IHHAVHINRTKPSELLLAIIGATGAVGRISLVGVSPRLSKSRLIIDVTAIHRDRIHFIKSQIGCKLTDLADLIPTNKGDLQNISITHECAERKATLTLVEASPVSSS